MIGYTCKYTPVELLKAFGGKPVLLDGEEPDFEQAEALTHANLCCHAKALIQQGRRMEELILMDCCDSLRRSHDVLQQEKRHVFLELMDLPHENGQCARERFREQLVRLADDYGRNQGRFFSREDFLEACRENVQFPMNEPFLAVLGARVSPPLLALIQNQMALPVVNLTCSQNRNLDEPPKKAEKMEFEQLMDWYAGALLRMTPCMRMCDVTGRRALTNNPKLKGIIYNTVKFCDYYGFDYASLKRETSIPILKIESDYMPQPSGQLSTRLEAFSESLMPKTGLGRSTMNKIKQKGAGADQGAAGDRAGQCGEHAAGEQAGQPNKQAGQPNKQAAGDQADKKAGQSNKQAGQRSGDQAAGRSNKQAAGQRSGALYAGIDSGSTTTNMVVIDETKKILASAIVRTGAKAQNGANAALQQVCEKLSIEPDQLTAILATGYGRSNIPFATDTRTEITCHARGAFFLNPDVRTIVDIGGQDSKVICLDETGAVVNFIMNDKCAAGTGRFLEMMARTLELDMEEMSRMGLSWKKDLTISSMCTVFAESEVISLIADNHSAGDIIHGLNKSIAAKTGSMVSRAKGRGPYMMTGGVARNRGVVRELESRLGESLFITDAPDLCGALGAALFALEGDENR